MSKNVFNAVLCCCSRTPFISKGQKVLLAETVTLIVCVKEVFKIDTSEKQESIPVGCVRTAAVARGLAYPPPPPDTYLPW